MNRYNFNASFEKWDEISEKIHSLLITNGVSESDIRKIMMALEEGIANIISYNDEKTDIILTCEVDTDGHRAVFVLEDDGTEFDPTVIPDADTSQEVVKNRVGGMGITMTRNLMDETSYCYNGRNIFTMIKYLGENSGVKDRFIITDKKIEILVELPGAFKTSDSDEFGELLMQVITNNRRTVLDMTDTEYICSGVLREMLTCQAEIDDINSDISNPDDMKEMVIINVNDEIMQVFEMTGFNNILTIE